MRTHFVPSTRRAAALALCGLLGAGIALAAGKTWSYTPAVRGQFDYKCTIHPTMKGSLVVH